MIPQNALDRTLIVCARPDATTAMLPPLVDWSGLLAAAAPHGLIPLVNHVLPESAAPPDVKDAFQNHAMGLTIRAEQLRRAFAQVLVALRNAGVTTVVLKGPALAETIYPESSLRPYTDLDLLCHEDDWAATHEVFRQLGFTQVVQRPANPPPKVLNRKAYPHTVFRDRRNKVQVEVHYDLWWNELRPRLGDAYWRRSVATTIAGEPTRVLSPEDQLLLLCVHLHRHGYRRLIWFSDLGYLIRRNPRLDWDYVIRAASTEGIGLSVYFSLTYLDRLLEVATPERVRDQLKPGPLQGWLHRRFWPPESFLVESSEKRVDFGFDEVPCASELVLNLLLTGRRLEKMLYLGRLLVPSRDWLAYYYNTNDPAVLRRIRLIHAPKLLAKGFQDWASGRRQQMRARRAVAAERQD